LETPKKDLAASRGSASPSNPTAHQYASPIVSICHESVKRDLEYVKQNNKKGHGSQRYLGNAEVVAQDIELCEDLVDSRKELAEPVKREYVKRALEFVK
jgi:hypothetical protein